MESRSGEPGTPGLRSPEEGSAEAPLVGYATLETIFSTGLILILGALTRERLLPRRWTARDLVMTGVATHRLARILTRDKVTMPIRAPFVHFEGPAGAGEVRQRPRGRGLRRAIGTLLTCPFCAGPWIATVSLAALLVRPRAVRFVQAIFVTDTISDVVQQLYSAVRKLS